VKAARKLFATTITLFN